MSYDNWKATDPQWEGEREGPALERCQRCGRKPVEQLEQPPLCNGCVEREQFEAASEWADSLDGSERTNQ